MVTRKAYRPIAVYSELFTSYKHVQVNIITFNKKPKQIPARQNCWIIIFYFRFEIPMALTNKITIL
jgi:hypothetical protein